MSFTIMSSCRGLKKPKKPKPDACPLCAIGLRPDGPSGHQVAGSIRPCANQARQRPAPSQ
jgi:hypothetical protein